MIKSNEILPIRFYDDLNDQDRFNRNCDGACENQLNYPVNALPFFQITRETSSLTATEFFLRNVCSDKVHLYKSLTENVSNMEEVSFTNYFGTLNQTYSNIDPSQGNVVKRVGFLSCGSLYNEFIDPTEFTAIGPVNNLIITSQTCKYRVKITVEKLKKVTGSSFHIDILDGTSIIKGSIYTAGAYTFDFINTTGSIQIRLTAFRAGDMYSISYIQAEVIDISCFARFTSDVTLDKTKVKVIQLENGTDILVYCEGLQKYAIEPGDYYYFLKCEDIRSGDSELYFSEVFTIKSVKDIQDYYRLKWFHSCDVNGKIIYDPTLAECDYYNTVYLNSELFRPEYPITNDGEEDGAGNFNSLLKKWQKTIVLEVGSCPEFLSDALSAVFIHDNISLLAPINKNQLRQSNEFTVLRVDSTEVTGVFNDCRQNVNLKLLITENIVVTGCCDNIQGLAGRYAQYRSTDACDAGYDYKLELSDPAVITDGLFQCDPGVLVPVKQTDIIEKDIPGAEKKFYQLFKDDDDIYKLLKLMPLITGVISGTDDITGEDIYIVSANVIPYTTALVEHINNGEAWQATNSVKTSGSDGEVVINVPQSYASGAADFKLRILMYTVDEDISRSDEFDVI